MNPCEGCKRAPGPVADGWEQGPEAEKARHAAARLEVRKGTWTRAEVAEFLNVSTKTVQRLEAKGYLRRCPALGSAVRFPVGDVRKLASADGKEI